MLIGVPQETLPGEKRVATVPDVVAKLVKLGFRVAVQSGAGNAANFADETYVAAGAEIVPTAAELWATSDIVFKVRPPTADEVALMSKGRVIARGTPAELIAAHAGRDTAEVYAPPERRAEIRAAAEAAGLDVRAAGPAIAIVGSERSANGLVPDNAVIRPASLEDVFVLLTGEELE